MNIPINHKRMYRTMSLENLLVPPQHKNKAKRTPPYDKTRTFESNAIWGTDMTKIMIPEYGWAYLHAVIDWRSKKIVGYSLEGSSKTED